MFQDWEQEEEVCRETWYLVRRLRGSNSLSAAGEYKMKQDFSESWNLCRTCLRCHWIMRCHGPGSLNDRPLSVARTILGPLQTVAFHCRHLNVALFAVDVNSAVSVRSKIFCL